MGGRSGQGINQVANVTINAPDLPQELQEYALKVAQKYGLSGQVTINVQKSNQAGGYVEMNNIVGNGIETKVYMNDNTMTILSGSFSKNSELSPKEIIRHELKHVQQGKEKRLYIAYDNTMKKPIKKFFFDGKAVISETAFNKVMKFKTKTDYETYKNFPWEKEAYATAGDS